MSESNMLRRYRVWFVLVGVILGLLFVPATALSRAARIEQSDTQTQPPYHIWLPLIMREPLSYRLGFGSISESLSPFPLISSLKAGWYVDWNVQRQPARPNAMEYVQVIRVHQKLTCPLGSPIAYDRVQCPYAEPLDYVISPARAQIEEALRANPGSLWLIGNEMDRRDWPVYDGSGHVIWTGGQDEILPETYADAYHDLYYFIKGIDPSAQVAIGGIIQATPLRLEYLTKMWDAYQMKYSTLITPTMPVDVWNVHNFILQERLCCHGASIPPGSTETLGTLYSDSQHVDMGIFGQQIRAFRQWMKDRGQQNKPLIVSEYGVLYRHIEETDTAQEVQDFMVRTFDYFLEARDNNLGYPADDYRLVQRWAWYSLEDTGTWNGFNEFGALFDPATKQITSTGIRYRTYSLTNMSRLVKWPSNP